MSRMVHIEWENERLSCHDRNRFDSLLFWTTWAMLAKQAQLRNSAKRSNEKTQEERHACQNRHVYSVESCGHLKMSHLRFSNICTCSTVWTHRMYLLSNGCCSLLGISSKIRFCAPLNRLGISMSTSAPLVFGGICELWSFWAFIPASIQVSLSLEDFWQSWIFSLFLHLKSLVCFHLYQNSLLAVSFLAFSPSQKFEPTTVEGYSRLP